MELKDSHTFLSTSIAVYKIKFSHSTLKQHSKKVRVKHLVFRRKYYILQPPSSKVNDVSPVLFSESHENKSLVLAIYLYKM